MRGARTLSCGRAGPAAILGAPVALLTTHCLLSPPQLCWLQLCPTRSIWTIDLAHLLAACGACVQLLKVLNVKGSNPVVLAGDSHNAWAHELIDSSGHRWAPRCLFGRR